MDELTTTLLSRYLDGDLESAESRALEERLLREPQLGEDLAALENLRASIAALAQRDEPPPELDRLMEPLRRGAPEGPHVRPWLRWAGVAAAVALGLTVVLEVNRSTPGPEYGKGAPAVHRVRSVEPTKRFALAPLPTASTPEEEQPLGAADRLLASPIPERELAGTPPALEVLGPLNYEEDETFAVGDTAQAVSEKNAPAPLPDRKRQEAATGKAGKASPASPGGPSGGRSALAPHDADKRGEGGKISEVAPQSVDGEGACRLFVSVDGKTIWKRFHPKRRCPPGRFIVRIEVVGGSVAKALPFGEVSFLGAAEACAADLVSGLDIEDVSDGEYEAEVVIEAEGAR